ncbi:hypothetical protein Btru_058074 [Bulinus truncatus]|nr:hypothetical protein Btru_058074 [Bulinus truncatus]
MMSAKMVIAATLSLSVVMFILVSVTNYPEDRAAMASPVPTGKNEVLLLSYGRSGSSFTSGLISYHPDVFFVFEPLHALEEFYGSEKFFKQVSLFQ